MYYLAYGSNLNKAEMAVRCNNAKFVGVATVDDMELEFRYYLSVKEKENSKLLVGVWEISDDLDWQYLDYYEGYPTLYKKQSIKANLNGETIYGIIYIMNENRASYSHNLKPTKDYFERCWEGYENCNMSVFQLVKALNNCNLNN